MIPATERIPTPDKMPTRAKTIGEAVYLALKIDTGC